MALGTGKDEQPIEGQFALAAVRTHIARLGLGICTFHKRTAVAGGPLAEAAAQLGVTEQELQTALGDPELGPPDLMAVAEQLGVSVEVLEAALGTMPDLERP